MSSKQIRQFSTRAAVVLCRENLGLLSIAVKLNDPRRHINALVRNIEFALEHTGGTVETTALRAELAELKREIARREFEATAAGRKQASNVVKGPWSSN